MSARKDRTICVCGFSVRQNMVDRHRERREKESECPTPKITHSPRTHDAQRSTQVGLHPHRRVRQGGGRGRGDGGAGQVGGWAAGGHELRRERGRGEGWSRSRTSRRMSLLKKRSPPPPPPRTARPLFPFALSLKSTILTYLLDRPRLLGRHRPRPLHKRDDGGPARARRAGPHGRDFVPPRDQRGARQVGGVPAHGAGGGEEGGVRVGGGGRCSCKGFGCGERRVCVSAGSEGVCVCVC